MFEQGKSANFMEPINENLIMNKFYHILNGHLYTRCAELTVLLERTQLKDLQVMFPILVDHIFGSAGYYGWGIRSVTQETSLKEFKIVHHFLSPMGPMFRLIYKLLGESSLKYDYLLDQLPAKLRANLESSQGNIPAFYNDLIYQDMQTRQLLCLKLNPFDYYMFHFAWHLISPWQQRSKAHPWGCWNSVYYILVCDYLLHFLPTDPNSPVPLPYVHGLFAGKNPMAKSPQLSNRHVRVSKLFLPQVLQQAALEVSSLHQNGQQHPRSEIWRTETIINVFIDIWLNYDNFFSSNDMAWMRNSLQACVLPSNEYVRVVRVVVKQFHAFHASGRGDITPMGDLKRLLLPMFQGKIYIFLRHLIHRWPLDGSFRLVLELWLSFIQPWRYAGTPPLINTKAKEAEDVNKPNTLVDSSYMRFMAENLLAYTVIFQQLLPRFLKIDLSSPKNALMIFRVTKVFAQSNLVPMLREIEECIDNSNHSPSHSLGGIWTPSLPPLSPTSNWSTNTPSVQDDSKEFRMYHSFMASQKSPNKDHMSSTTPKKSAKWTAIVRQQIFDLEGPEFYYKTMFSGQPAVEVMRLAFCLQQAVDVVRQDLVTKELKRDICYSGFLSTLSEALFPARKNVDDVTPEERKSVPVYLELSREYLKKIFDITDNNLSIFNDELQEENETASNISRISNLNTSMTPREVYNRAARIAYEGDPDLMPVRSHEFGFVVSLLYTLSLKLNQTFGETFRDAFHRNDFIGCIARQVLQPPKLIRMYDKSFHGVSGIISPRIERVLPPRISLRSMASYSFTVFLITILLFFQFIFPSNYVVTIMILCLLYCLYIVFKALLSHISNNFVPSPSFSSPPN